MRTELGEDGAHRQEVELPDPQLLAVGADRVVCAGVMLARGRRVERVRGGRGALPGTTAITPGAVLGVLRRLARIPDLSTHDPIFA